MCIAWRVTRNSSREAQRFDGPYSAYLPEPDVTADIEQMALYAGQSCSLINAVQPAAEIVSDIVRSASTALERLTD